MYIANDEVVLFQGDSITDAGRDRNNGDHLGYGYAMMAAAWYSACHPQSRIKFINRGISGDRAVNLKERWDIDCIALKPTLVSIYIGINDCWRRYDNNDPTSPEAFSDHYKTILDETCKQLDAKLVLIEPFVLPVLEKQELWREDLDPKINVVRALAREYKAQLLPLDGIFSSLAVHQALTYWAHDGVHPSQAGHAVIAKEWLKLTSSCFTQI